MKRSLAAIWMLFAILSGANAGSLRLTLATDKKHYRPSETIRFILRIDNLTAQRTHLYIDDIYNARYFTVTDEKNATLPIVLTTMYDSVWSADAYKPLEANASYRWTIEAKLRDNATPTLDFGDSQIRLMHRGKFKLYATYKGWDGVFADKNGSTIPLGRHLGIDKVFVGTLRSNTVTIEVE